MQVTVIINGAVAHAEILQCWLGRERAVLQDFSDEHETENFPMSPRSFVKKNLVCDGRVRPE